MTFSAVLPHELGAVLEARAREPETASVGEEA